jgi:uncharacterized repeat protein (TIGR04138 family)
MSTKAKKGCSPRETFEKLELLSEKYPCFRWESFNFILAGMNFTRVRTGERRHITGRELSEGIRDFALGEFGPLAYSVLEHLGIRSTEDLGKAVFAMIEAGILFRDEKDSIRDFEGLFSLKETLRDDYRRKLRERFKFEPILKPLRPIHEWISKS